MEQISLNDARMEYNNMSNEKFTPTAKVICTIKEKIMGQCMIFTNFVNISLF